MKKRFDFRALIQYSRLTRVTILLSCLILLGNVNFAISELTHDPSIDPIPIMDFSDLSKVIVVNLNFLDTTTVEILSTEVVYGFPPARAGHPPLLEVTLHDLDGFRVEQFNAWNPLWKFVWDGSGNERLEIQSEGTGTIIFPFRPEVATARIINLIEIQEIILVDLIPMLHNFYNEHPDDPDFTNVVNRPPTCSANGPYSMECADSHTVVTLNGTGSDPDMDSLDYLWGGLFEDGTASGKSPTVQFSDVGLFTVELTVDDNFGGTATCDAEVEIVDTAPPSIECNAPTTITPPDAPISFSSSATDICLGQNSAAITGFDCFKFTKKGERVDKTESCVVQIEGDTITIVDSGGVGDHIAWTVFASDDSGNDSEIICEVEVVRP